MTLEEKRRAYQQFFLKSEAGQAFMGSLYGIIDTNHTEAEKDGDKARDYSQRAKGARQVIEHIKGLTAERRARQQS